MRLPYKPPIPPPLPPSSAHKSERGTLDAETSSKAAIEAYANLSERRSPDPLLALDLTLLHAPPVATGWSSFFDSIRRLTSLGSDIRELIICRVAALNGAEYEWEQHAPMLRNALFICRVAALNGAEYEWEQHAPILRNALFIAERAVEELKKRKAWQGWEESGVGGLGEKHRAVLAYADAMTVSVKIPDEIFVWVRRLFEDKEIVEITATVAAYNCVSRILVALDVGEMKEKEKENEKEA
ncbi:hypothetical protein MMC21_000213 [Puttea exsequens]|nr:hypothetical protein [Puttea exsequens]